MLKINIYFKIDYLVRLRRSPFRVTTSYAEHFHLVSVHVQKLDFHDDCPTHRGKTETAEFGWGRQPPDMEGSYENIK
jgi:hypothetical protein